MAAPQSTPLPLAPGPNDPGDVFDDKAYQFTSALEPFRQELQGQADFVDTKATAADDSAQSSAASAAASADFAEAAEGAAKTYEDTTEGLSATADGEYFTIPSAAAGGYLDLYKNNGGVASLQRTSASDQVVTEAETARDAAQTAEQGAQAHLTAIQDLADFYADIAAGLAGTVDGEYFRVMASGDTAANLYRNDSGSETLIATFPTQQGLDAWEQSLRQDIVDLVKNPDEIPVKTVFFLGETGSFIDVSSAGV